MVQAHGFWARMDAWVISAQGQVVAGGAIQGHTPKGRLRSQVVCLDTTATLHMYGGHATCDCSGC
jgi:hypothetical protein